ncbi:hypothetical protein M3Y97_00138300 [Aphelenchoides bicaudatus]|nr:hypothetical protein M3Y97_00138300 [Aphelenchoides bicaudatus]
MTPSHKKVATDWTTLKINDKEWLPLEVQIDSVASIIRNLDLRHVNVTHQVELFNAVDEQKVVGFVCTSDKNIQLDQLADYQKQWKFIPVQIQNSAPTIQILNLCAVNGKHRDVTYGYMLEKYLTDSSSSKENCALSNSVYAITPISFAHNFTARDFPAKNPSQQVMVFACLSNRIVQISQDGTLQTFKESALSAKKQCQVYIITEDPVKEVYQKLEAKKEELSQLIKKKNLDESNAHLDESLTYEDLKELSQLSEQIEDAEAFELLVDNGSLTTKTPSTPKPSTSTTTRVHKLEEQIRQFVKQLEDIQKIFPHICWHRISDSDLYGSKEYLRFYSHYKNVLHVATPKLLKSYEFAPIRTPKADGSKNRKRAGSTTSSLSEQLTEVNGTPKRRRSSRTSRPSNVSKK